MLDLSTLNPKEKEEALALLELLNIDVSKVSKRKKSRPVVILKSYINCYENRCMTCNHVSFEYYCMKQHDGADFLRGLPIDKNEVDSSMDIQTHVRKITTCKHCIERLSRLEKEDIIRMLIKEKLKWI